MSARLLRIGLYLEWQLAYQAWVERGWYRAPFAAVR